MNFNWEKLIPERLGGPNDETIYHQLFGSGEEYVDNSIDQIRNRIPFWKKVMFWKRVMDKNLRRVMEIGIGYGINSIFLLSISDKYYGFDNFSRDETKRVCKVLEKYEKSRLFFGDSKKTIPEVDLPGMDLIFIDGGHDYKTVKNDWENSKKIIEIRGDVWFHDYSSCEGVKRVVDEIDACFTVDIIEPDVGPSFARVRRKKDG